MPTPTQESTEDMVERVRLGVVRISTDGGSGSGAIFEVNSDGIGLVLTNEHVIRGTSEVTVIVGDKDSYSATVIGVDPQRDLALLRICCGEFVPLSLVSSLPRLGTKVFVLGYPLGFKTMRVNAGIVSAVVPDVERDRIDIQTDAAINSGNSGGPLVNSLGEVVGLNTWGIREWPGAASVEGFGFAVSIDTIRNQLTTLRGGGWVQPTPTPHPMAPQGVYTNTEYGYSIDVPEGWILDADDPDEVTVWEDKTGAYAVVWVSNECCYLNIAHYVSKWVPTFSGSTVWSDVSLIDNGPIKGRTAHEWQYQGLLRDEPYKGFIHWYTSAQQSAEVQYQYWVEITAPAAIWDNPDYAELELKLRLALVSFTPSSP